MYMYMSTSWMNEAFYEQVAETTNIVNFDAKTLAKSTCFEVTQYAYMYQVV